MTDSNTPTPKAVSSLPFQKCATLGTAANMNNASICREKFCDLEVVTICTGGVEGNAGRAGDPATYYEPQSSSNAIVPKEQECIPRTGTINAMIFICQSFALGFSEKWSDPENKI